MLDLPVYETVKQFMMALALTQPRILALFVPVPIFNGSILPGMLRLAIGAGLGMVVAPTMMTQVAGMEFEPARLVALIAKEVFVGFVLGCLIAVPFWAFEAVGFFIDNQRGASIAATLNPLTGNDSSPLGILFNQAFNVFVFISGGFLLLLGVLYDSFRLWNVLEWSPVLRPETMSLLIQQILSMVALGLLLASPAIVAMFLAELGLALVSRFVPQLQVFFMAMPIKSALAILVLMVYASMLFEYGKESMRPLADIVPTLNDHWRAAPPTR